MVNWNDKSSGWVANEKNAYPEAQGLKTKGRPSLVPNITKMGKALTVDDKHSG